MRAWAVAVVALAIAGCEAPLADEASVAPTVATEPPMRPATDVVATEPPMLPVGDAVEAELVAPDANTFDATAPDARATRIEAWMSTPFACRAISTTRLRTCRFEREGEDGEVAITFPVADLTCRRVIWDERGDPARLEECRSRWLRVPREIVLSRSGDTWSGSHAGWRWRDGETYCCPGAWISAPDALREGAPALEPLDADRDTPPPKPPRE